MRKFLSAFMIFILFVPAARPAHGITFTTIDAPFAAFNTQIFGISGNSFVGDYDDGFGNDHGFLFDGSNYTKIDYPPAPAETVFSTTPLGISGNTIVGAYNDSEGGFGIRGFTYNGTTYTSVEGPVIPDFLVFTGIEGNRIVGYNDNAGILYDGSTFTTIYDPHSLSFTLPYGISGNTVIGTYNDLNTTHGFVYDIPSQSYTTLDDPLAAGTSGGTHLQGIAGNDIVGFYYDQAGVAHGFLYDGSTFRTLDDPLAGSGKNQGTFIRGISGNTIAGYYIDADNTSHGFIASVPEPSSIVLLAVAGLCMASALRRGRSTYLIAMPTSTTAIAE